MNIGFKKVTPPAIRQIIVHQTPLPGALGATGVCVTGVGVRCLLRRLGVETPGAWVEREDSACTGTGQAGSARRFPVQSPGLQAGPPHASRPHLPTTYVYLTSDLACLTFDVSFAT